jgi:hypothetical protein
MFKAIKESGKEKYNVTEFVCDTIEDIKDLPTTVEVGSTAIVIKDTRIFMLNNKKEWEEL